MGRCWRHMKTLQEISNRTHRTYVAFYRWKGGQTQAIYLIKVCWSGKVRFSIFFLKIQWVFRCSQSQQWWRFWEDTYSYDAHIHIPQSPMCVIALKTMTIYCLFHGAKITQDSFGMIADDWDCYGIFVNALVDNRHEPNLFYSQSHWYVELRKPLYTSTTRSRIRSGSYQS